MVDENGTIRAVTLVQIENAKVTKVLNPERDGYHGIQVGYYDKKEKHLNKPDISRLRKAGIDENYSRFKEFRFDDAQEGMEVGAQLTTDLFEGVTAVDVTGLTKGRGFQGATKRWNHKTGRRTHGSRFHRRPGSLGMRTTPGRVFKGKHMPGHMGHKQRTVQNLAVLDVDKDSGTIAIKGSIPGNRHEFVILKPSVKAK